MCALEPASLKFSDGFHYCSSHDGRETEWCYITDQTKNSSAKGTKHTRKELTFICKVEGFSVEDDGPAEEAVALSV